MQRRVVFADSGYWIAVLYPRDQYHQQAARLDAELATASIVTTEMVLAEMLNFMSSLGEFRRQLAADMVENLEDAPNVEVIPQTSAQFRAAVERYVGRGDQRWSVTDCASFLAMEDRGITEALAYDRDFERAGFVALLRGDQQ